jgi:hypothetical protein
MPWVSKWFERERLRGLDACGEMGDNCWEGCTLCGDKWCCIGGNTVGEGCIDDGVAYVSGSLPVIRASSCCCMGTRPGSVRCLVCSLANSKSKCFN